MVVRVSWASPISVHVGVPFGRSVFVVFAATPTFATEAVPSVALVASSVEAVVPGMAIAFPGLVVVSAAASTLIEMPHATHPFFFRSCSSSRSCPTTLTRIACLRSRCLIQFRIERALRVRYLTAFHEALPNNSHCVQSTLLFVSRVIASVP